MIKKIGLILATMVTASWSMESQQKPNVYELGDLTDWYVVPEREQEHHSSNPLPIAHTAFTGWLDTAYTTCHDLFFPRPQSNEEEPITKNNSAPKFVYDIFIKILGTANENGLDLKTYRSEASVCKEWRVLATNSITKLQIIKLMETTRHRKWTLLAHIIADYPLHRFPNLIDLALPFPTSAKHWIELTTKLQDPEKRNFANKSKFLSNDGQLDAIDKDYKLIEEKAMIKAKKFRAKITDPHTGRASKFFTLIGGVFSVVGMGGEILWDAAWESHYIGAPFSPTKAKNIEDNLMVTMNKQIIEALLDFKNITRLRMLAWDGINPYFIQNMPHLKELGIGHEKWGHIYLDALGNMQHEHGLEKLALLGALHISSFEGWLKFHKLKELILNLTFYDDARIQIEDANQLHKILDSLVINLPHIEKLTIGSRLDPNILLYQHISKLSKLTELGLLVCLLSNDELKEISKFENLKKLIIIGDSLLFREQLSITMQFANFIFEQFTPEGLAFFKQMRPDVDVSIIEGDVDESGTMKLEI